MNDLGFILHVMGELIIAYSILTVHRRISIERKIDSHIVHTINRERMSVFFGIALIVTGSLIEFLFS